jgi:hypothetical protein
MDRRNRRDRTTSRGIGGTSTLRQSRRNLSNPRQSGMIWDDFSKPYANLGWQGEGDTPWDRLIR